MRFETATQHCAVAGVAGTDADGQDERVGLQVADPDGVEAFIEDVEGREETAERDGHVGISDKVELGVVDADFRVAEDPLSQQREIRTNRVAKALEGEGLTWTGQPAWRESRYFQYA